MARRGVPKTLRRIRKAVQAGIREYQDPLFVPVGHYYSPLPSTQDMDRALARPVGEVMDIDARLQEQDDLGRGLGLSVPPEGRWLADNDMFGPADAAVLQAMLLRFKPARVLEVGSGYSTALMLDVADREMPGLRVTCIEPYADRLKSRLRPEDYDRLTLIESDAQDVSLDTFTTGVGPGDFLFIDSTHVVKLGSDVCYLLFEVLPRLPVGVIVHIHDMFWPFEYPDSWVRSKRHWTELYLVRAFLQNNSDWEIVFFSSWFWQQHNADVPPQTQQLEPGSLWLRRKA